MQITLPEVKLNHYNGVRERAMPRGKRAPAPNGVPTRENRQLGRFDSCISHFTKGEFLDMVTYLRYLPAWCASSAAVGDER